MDDRDDIDDGNLPVPVHIPRQADAHLDRAVLDGELHPLPVRADHDHVPHVQEEGRALGRPLIELIDEVQDGVTAWRQCRAAQVIDDHGRDTVRVRRPIDAPVVAQVADDVHKMGRVGREKVVE